eukprot:1282168-Pyramimonas_sp.AAC.1
MSSVRSKATVGSPSFARMLPLPLSIDLTHKYLHGKSREQFLHTLSVDHEVLRDVALSVARLRKQLRIQDVVVGTH